MAVPASGVVGAAPSFFRTWCGWMWEAEMTPDADAAAAKKEARRSRRRRAAAAAAADTGAGVVNGGAAAHNGAAAAAHLVNGVGDAIKGEEMSVAVPRAASGAMGVLVDASNVVTELRAGGTPVDVGSLLRIGDVVVAVDGVVLGARRLKAVMAEVAKADVHTFTVRRL